METDAGSGTRTFVLKQEGEKLTGAYTGALGEANVTGTVKGNDVTIEFTVGAMDARIRYTGRLEGDNKMSGKVDLGGQASGTFKASRK